MWAIRGFLNVRSSRESRISRGPAMPRERSSCAADMVIVAPAESPIRLTLLAPTSVTNSSARSAITGTTWAADPKGNQRVDRHRNFAVRAHCDFRDEPPMEADDLVDPRTAVGVDRSARGGAGARCDQVDGPAIAVGDADVDLLVELRGWRK